MDNNRQYISHAHKLQHPNLHECLLIVVAGGFGLAADQLSLDCDASPCQSQVFGKMMWMLRCTVRCWWLLKEDTRLPDQLRNKQQKANEVWHVTEICLGVCKGILY